MEKQKEPVDVDHREHERISNSGDSGEKGVAAPATGGYNANNEFEEPTKVTFKAWVVITVLASAYGVGTPSRYRC
jgi:hypothetical protein